jgi:myo-inositol-hexaphosphate 3-phosphohydrolase
VADVEGMTIYYRSDGGGYLIVSSQGNSVLNVYQRVPPSPTDANVLVGQFHVMANGTIDETSQTDGIDVTNFPLGSAFPGGLFVVHDNANSGATASNLKLVPWEALAMALNLDSDPFWDPQQIGAESTP